MGSAMRYQPQGLPRLNASNPLVRGLVGFWLPNGGGFVSAVPGIANATRTANGVIAAGPKGLRLGSIGAALSATIAHDPRVKPTAAMTMLVDGVMPALAGYSPALGCENSNDGWGLYASAAGQPMHPYLRVGAAWADQASGITTGASGQVGFTFDGSTFWAVTNGARGASQAISGSITNSSIGIGINAKSASATQFGNGAFYYLAIWNRALSPAELASFYANPWQLFDAGSGNSAYQAAIATADIAAAQSRIISPAGGIALTGVAAAVRSTLRQAQGGMQMTGAAQQSRAAARSVVGGMQLGGTSAQTRTRAPAPAGGLQFSGAASATTNAAKQLLTVIAAGGIALAGAAQRVASALRTTAGGIAFGGSSDYTNSGIVPRLSAIMRRRARPRNFPTSR